jgi:hypothetical protein
MSAQGTLYQAVEAKLQEVVSGQGVRITAVRRLALVITGLVAGKSSVVSQMAVGLWEQGVSTVQVASIARRLRRGLHDARVQAATWYQPAVHQVVDWGSLRQRGQAVVLALDESSQEERLHLLRMSLTYWGKALPLAWRLWPQNTPLAAGAYWGHIDGVLAETAATVPADLDVVVTADRAYDIPPFIDRVAALGGPLEGERGREIPRSPGPRAGSGPTDPPVCGCARAALEDPWRDLQAGWLAHGQSGRGLGARGEGAPGRAHGSPTALGGAAPV